MSTLKQRGLTEADYNNVAKHVTILGINSYSHNGSQGYRMECAKSFSKITKGYPSIQTQVKFYNSVIAELRSANGIK